MINQKDCTILASKLDLCGDAHIVVKGYIIVTRIILINIIRN